jgi:hypothetical protein
MGDPELHRNLAGYCGLFCGACDIHCLHRSGQETGKEPQWSDLPQEFQKHLPFGPAPVRCKGCHSDEVFIGCSHCPIRSCARKRGVEGSCVDCARYPCFRYGLVRVVTFLASMEKKLPHLGNRAANRKRMARLGVEQWMKEQDVHWRCPDCRARYSWYARACSSCGRDLSALDRFSVAGD